MYRYDQDPRFTTLASHASYVHPYTTFYINRVARHVAAATPFPVYDMLASQPVCWRVVVMVIGFVKNNNGSFGHNSKGSDEVR